MYSWNEDPSTWYGKSDYSYGKAGEATRADAARRAVESGPRSYHNRGMPDTQRTDPTKSIRSESRNPIVIAVDVTGSMAQWPFEIFDRLPLLYNTISQYRDDVSISFMAIGDERADRWPFQVTNFAHGFDLEDHLKAIYGEGGGGDLPESYALAAWYLVNRVSVPNAVKPFFIVFGDAPMHPVLPRERIKTLLGVDCRQDYDAIKVWRQVVENWNVWFLRRPTGRKGDETEQQWARAIGGARVVTIQDEIRAVDCAMGIVARAWGHFDDFRANMLARQNEAVVRDIEAWVDRVRVISCTKCGAPVPPEAHGRISCKFCGVTLDV